MEDDPSDTYVVWGQIEAQPAGAGEPYDISDPEPLGRFDSLAEARRFLLNLSADPQHSPLAQETGQDEAVPEPPL